MLFDQAEDWTANLALHKAAANGITARIVRVDLSGATRRCFESTIIQCRLTKALQQCTPETKNVGFDFGDAFGMAFSVYQSSGPEVAQIWYAVVKAIVFFSLLFPAVSLSPGLFLWSIRHWVRWVCKSMSGGNGHIHKRGFRFRFRPSESETTVL